MKMKKTLKIALLACFVLGFSLANAQEEDLVPNTRYPHYGFWSNWSIGVNGGWTYRLHKETIDMPNNTLNNDNRSGWGLGIFAAKELNYIWDVRLKLNYADVDTKIKNVVLLNNQDFSPNVNYIGEHLNLNLDFTLSIIDAINGYKSPYRKLQWYVNAGMGTTFLLPDKNRQNPLGSKEIWLGNSFFSANIGTGLSWRFVDNFSLYIEPSFWFLADIPELNKGNVVGSYLYVPVGLEYHFGTTESDYIRIEQEKMFTQENFDAISSEKEDALEELGRTQKNVQDLKNKIASLEDVNGQLKNKLDKTEADNNRLKNALKNIKDNQSNLYGMPLSILYPNDVWQVPSDQYRKLKAVAEVMKENENTNFTIIGFCDEPASYEYNDKLSEKRANEVKRLLVKKYGIAEERLTVKYKGKRESFGNSKLSINRRVSFYVNLDEE
jgi:outer membrane protein OmpA-like peptidoglycan-associated protein